MHLLVSIWIDQLGDYVCPSFLLQLYYCMSQSVPFPFLFFLVGESAHMAIGVLDSIVQGAILYMKATCLSVCLFVLQGRV